MAGNLGTSFAIPNGQRLVFGTFVWDDDAEVLFVPLELRTTVANGNKLICGVNMTITNGSCTLLSRAAPNTAVGLLDAAAYFVVSTRTVANGYTAAQAVRNAGGTKAVLRAALELHMGSAGAGHVDSTLAYT